MSCPACFENYTDLGGDIKPTKLPCNCVLCSRCIGQQFEDGALCCPLCCKEHRCNNAAQFPTVPIPSLKEDGGSNMPLLPSRPSLDTSQVPASRSRPRESNARRLERFLASVAVEEEASVAGSAHSEEEGGGGATESLRCMVSDCSEERASGYLCSGHAGHEVSWEAVERNLTKLKKGKSVDAAKLKPEILSSRFLKQKVIDLDQVLFLIDQVLEILSKEPNVLNLEAPVKIVGDLHGQFFDLISMVNSCGTPNTGTRYLFLGDYVDRGDFSCEVFIYLMALKVAHPQHVHLLRGNHETRNQTSEGGFKAECVAKYGLAAYYRFLRVFVALPLCAVVKNDHGAYFCTHGGISPNLTLGDISALNRRVEPEGSGLLCDLLWADPVDDPGVVSRSGQEPQSGHHFQDNPVRNCSVTFSGIAVREFLRRNGLLSVIRAHAVQEDGVYRHFQDLERPVDIPPVITVFSAPNYLGHHGNRAAVLEVLEGDLEPKVEHFNCVKHPRPRQRRTMRSDTCPYMPKSFEDWIRVAKQMGPALPQHHPSDIHTGGRVLCGQGARGISQGNVNVVRGKAYFTDAEMSFLRQLFIVMAQGNLHFIERAALEEYAKEEEKYFPKEADVAAFIEAVDLDADNKIGFMDFLSMAARLKAFYRASKTGGSSGWFGGRRSKLAVAVALGAVGLATTVAVACRRRRL